MPLSSRYMSQMNPAALGIGQMAGQRIAPQLAGPGMAMNVNTPGGGPMAPSAPPLPQEEQQGDGGLLGGLLGMLAAQKTNPQDQTAQELFNANMNGQGPSPALVAFQNSYPGGMPPAASMLNSYPQLGGMGMGGMGG